MRLFGRGPRDAAVEVGAQPEPRGSAASAEGRSAQSGRTPFAKRARKGEDMAHIGRSISIHGDLTGDEDLVLEGTVEGKVSLPNNELTIGANGLIPADVNAKSVIVIGHVRGNVNGTERVEIQASGVVEGDVRTPRLIVAEGAVLNGSILMADETPAKTVAVPAEPVADPAAKRGTSEARRSARSGYATGAS